MNHKLCQKAEKQELWHAHSEQDAVNINETYKNLIAE